MYRGYGKGLLYIEDHLRVFYTQKTFSIPWRWSSMYRRPGEVPLCIEDLEKVFHVKKTKRGYFM